MDCRPICRFIEPKLGTDKFAFAFAFTYTFAFTFKSSAAAVT